MKLKKRVLILVLVNIICVVIYSYHYFFISNTALYNAICYCIPALLIINLVVILISIAYGNRLLWLFSLLVFIYSVNIVLSFITFSFSKKTSKSDLTVLSYNVGTFNLDRFHKQDSIKLSDSSIIIQQRNFIKNSGADVICMQEFYNNDAVGFETVLNEMTTIGYKYYYMNPINIEGYRGFFGVITFSKFPIVGRGGICFDYPEAKRPALNTAIFTDVLVKEDTVRIINVHLHSMDLRPKRILNSLTSDTLAHEVDLIKEKMERGFIKRGEQVLTLENDFLKKGGKIILAGDLNDLPISFSYLTIRKYLKNSFENAGNGFGFTYNKFPWFIRIDNQFFDSSLQINSFEVLNENKFSDHFPVIGKYSFKRSNE
jgi:endonuclease/exonuclease/phosphatase family metal-dependent hydrolase